MKELSTTIFTNFVRVLGVMALCTLATVGTAFAGTISKTFEFGAGTPQPRSHVRTFPIPCGTPGGVAATVKFKRLGPAGASNDIPIIIEFREPDTAPNQEGPVVETKTATAKTTEQTIILRSGRNNRGCTLPWRVRVRYANEGAAPSRTFGSIRLDFDGRLRNIDIESPRHFLYKSGDYHSLKLGDSGGLDQGKIEISANWGHRIRALVPGPNPVLLKWELIDPNGTVVKTVEAYSSNEARSELTKFRLTHQVTKCTPGQWHLRISNNTNDDASVDRPRVYFKPDCP